MSVARLEQYIDYLKVAFEQEPSNMTAEYIDEEGLHERILNLP